MIFDTHIHTEFSTDSKMNIREVIEKSKKLGIGIITTDHMDSKFPIEGKFCFNIDEYFHEYNNFKNDTILTGIELGLTLETIDENIDIVSNNGFDYVIGSIHLVDNLDLGREDYYSQFSNKKRAYENYLEYMYRCIKQFNVFDSLGHIDYISRYSPYKDKEIYYREFGDYFDEIFKLLILKNKSIELNTNRLRSASVIENLSDIYKRYYELGGKTITLGSDAHRPEDIGRNFDIAYDIIKKNNLTPVHYKNRQIV